MKISTLKPDYIIILLLALTCLSAEAQLPTPQGTNCGNAVQVNGIPYASPRLPQYSTCGQGDTVKPVNACANTYTTGEDYLFKFTPNAGNSCISITLSALAISNGLFVFDGCPNAVSSVCVAQAINLNPPGNPVQDLIIKDLQLVPGRTYYILASSKTGCYSFNLDITAGTCGAVATGTGCEKARLITGSPFTDLNRSTCGKNKVFNRGNEKCSDFNYLDGGQYTYKYVSAIDQCVQIKVATDSNFTGFFVYEGCPTKPSSACIATKIFTTPGDAVINANFLAGREYYIVAGTRSDSVVCTNFDLTFNTISDSGSVCEKAYIFPGGDYTFRNHSTYCKGDDYDTHPGCDPGAPNYMNGEEVVYKFKGIAGACTSIILRCDYDQTGAVYVMDRCPSDPGARCLAFESKAFSATGNSMNLVFNAPSSDTFYIVVGVPSGTLDYDLTLINTSLLGRDCPNAHNITIPFNQKSMTVACKGGDYNLNYDLDQGNFMAGNDYVFKFTPAVDQCLRFTASNFSHRGGMYLFDRCPTAGVRRIQAVLCDAPMCDSISFLYTVKAGVTYFLVVDGFTNVQELTFDMKIEKLKSDDDCTVCGTDDCIACRNVGFERMAFTGWQTYTGDFANPKNVLALDSSSANNQNSRHTIMSAGSFDPIVGPALKSVSPMGGDFSARLGNRHVGGEGEVLEYKFTVDENSQNFIYYFAVVFEDPSHTPDQQPYFRVRVFLGNTEVQCAHFEVRAGPQALLPGFQTPPTNPNVRWRDWGLAAIPLKDYIGTEVTIDFTTIDCTAKAHFGYAYVDAYCGNLDILKSSPFICDGGEVTLTAPEGFASYLWNTGATSKSIVVTSPGTYSVQAMAFSDILDQGCTADFTTTIDEAPKPKADYDFILGCRDSIIDFKDLSTGLDTAPVVKWEWDFDHNKQSDLQNPTNHFPGPDTYDVTLIVTNSLGCKDTIEQTVEILEYVVLPPLNAIDTLRVCLDGKVQLYADDIPKAIYKWTGPGFSSTQRAPWLNNVKFNQGGWYYVYAELSDDSCQHRLDSTFLIVVPKPVFAAKKDTAICFLEKTVDLWASGGHKYEWQPAGLFTDNTVSNPLARIQQSTVYTVLITDTICPDTTIKVEVRLIEPKTPLTVDKDLNVCIGNSFTFSAHMDPSDNIFWTGPAGFASTAVTNTIAVADTSHGGYYKIEVFLGPNRFCKFGEDSLKVTIKPLPVVTFDPVDTICPGSSTELSALGAKTYRWFDESWTSLGNNQRVTVTPNDSDLFYAEGKDAFGCLDTGVVPVRVYPDFTVDAGPDRIHCTGDTAHLFVDTASFYQVPEKIRWSNGQSGPDADVWKAGEYDVEVTINGCTQKDSLNVDFQDLNTVDIGNDTMLCQGEKFVIDLRTHGSSATWGDGSTDMVRTISYPGGKFDVIIKSGSCILKDTIEVKFQPLHAVEIGNDTTFCLGGTLTVASDQNAGSFLWTDGPATFTTPSISISSAGNHNIRLEHTIGLCKATDTRFVRIETPPVPELGPPQAVCQGNSVTLDAGIPDASGYLWSNGSTTRTITVDSAGPYSVDVFRGTCKGSDVTSISHYPVPNFELGPDTTVCEGTPVSISASVSGQASYSWNTGATTPGITAVLPGKYTLTVTRDGCSFTDDLDVIHDSIPIFDLPDRLLCNGDSAILLVPVPCNSYAWNTGSTSPTITVKTGGTYYVDVTRGKCPGNDTVKITFHTPPPFDLGPDVTLCQGEQATFTCSTPADSYLWSDGSTTPSITTNVAAKYYLTLTSGPCVLKDSISLILDQPPFVDFGTDRRVCNSVNLQLDAGNSGSTYRWQDGSTNRTYQVSQGGIYHVLVTKGMCSDADTIEITVQPQHNLTLPPDTTLCTGESLLITSVTNALSPVYNWNNGLTSPAITVTGPDLYILEVVSGLCTAKDSINVSYVDPPVALLPENQVLCDGDSLELDPGYTTGNYNWNTGETTRRIVVNESGLYSVVMNIGRCEGRDDILVTFVPPPTLDLGPDLQICQGEERKLSPGIPAAEYTWSTGSQAQSITISEPGTYGLILRQGPCVVSDEMNLVVNPVPAPLKDTLICPTDSALVSAYCDGCTYRWGHDFTGSSFWSGNNKLYFVEITNSFGCRTETDIAVATDPACWDDIYVPNTFTPNGDGSNDLFKVEYANVKIHLIVIYDRWGELIYKSTSADEGWNGMFKGELAKEDTYIWKVTYTNMYRKKKEIHGHVNLLK